MSDTDEFDPFAGVEDDPDTGPVGARMALLDAAKRGFVPMRKIFPQRPAGSADQENRPSPRASVLYDLVNGRHQRAFDLLLLVHALQPILEGNPLQLGTWANIMSVRTPVTTTGVSRAIDTLVELKLVVRKGDPRTPVLGLLKEDGSGDPWVKAGSIAEVGPGYFVIPHDYWNLGLAERLTMPGKAMLMIALSETQEPTKTAFTVPVERAKEWYGLSERTAERGYRELANAGVILVKVQKIADKKHPAGRREVYWRALKAPFDTPSRTRLQRIAKKAARKATSGKAAAPKDAATKRTSRTAAKRATLGAAK